MSTRENPDAYDCTLCHANPCECYAQSEENQVKTILHLCADTGSDSKPYRDAGYNVICVGKDLGVEFYVPPKEVYGIIANPVCTEFSIAPGFHKERDLEKGMFLVNECLRIIEQAKPKFWVIENPASGRLKEFLGAPRMTYEPWHFGSPWTKKTALWGEFNIPQKKYTRWEDVPKNPALYVRPGRPKPSIAFMHARKHMPHIPEFQCFLEDILRKPARDRKNGGGGDMEFRSLCSQNFAKAFFEVNK